MMGGITECCKFCEERYPACHDYCEKYLEASREWEERKAHIKSVKEDEFYIYKITQIKEQRRGKHGK